MIAERFVRRWRGAGLIDEDTAERIAVWERAHRRPIGLWTLAGMGALAIGLGIMAVVGANWEIIPGWAKLGVDLALNGLCAAAVFVFWRRQCEWPRELAALVLFALVLSGIAVIGQVYQLQSDTWRALVLWLALGTPFLALATRTRLLAVTWAAAAVTTWFAASDPLHVLLARLGAVQITDQGQYEGYFVQVLVYLPVCAMVVVASLRGLWGVTRPQADTLLRLALAGLIAVTSLAVATDWSVYDRSAWLGPLVTGAAATTLAAASLRLSYDASLRWPALLLLAISFAAWAAGLLAAGHGGLGGDIVRALVFLVYWAVIGAAAARTGNRFMSGLAFTVIGLRLLVLYFQAIGGLTATGLGLIGGGVLCLVLAVLGWELAHTPRRPTGTSP